MFADFLGLLEPPLVLRVPGNVNPESAIGHGFPLAGMGDRLTALDQVADPDKAPGVHPEWSSPPSRRKVITSDYLKLQNSLRFRHFGITL
jgi:hypothetical protein